jgi:hypothetical protein
MRRPWSASLDRLQSRSKLVGVVALSVLALLNQGESSGTARATPTVHATGARARARRR